MGEECVWCGEKARNLLELDHIDKYEKAIKANRFEMVSWRRFVEELAKLQTLCKSCHYAKTALERKRKPIIFEFDWITGRMLPTEVILRRGMQEEGEDISFE